MTSEVMAGPPAGRYGGWHDRCRHPSDRRSSGGGAAARVARAALFSITAIFGTPMDVTVEELAIESFYPADEATATTLREFG
ncbi:MAG: hypothetical protein QOK11_2891 [Pseudonocardiales bacterium]|nr:hypothetical protein [Pseudonocardiales bacterium]